MFPLVHKTHLAEQDLINIWLYTLKEWGDKQADIYLDGIENTISLIAEQPKIGRLRDEFNPAVRVFYYAHHLIAYQVTDKQITIVRVLHKNMDIESFL